MEEARRVLARLERIEAIDRRRAAPQALLRELRALLDEAEAWARAEREGVEDALDAVRRCREALCEQPKTRESTSRTLIA